MDMFPEFAPSSFGSYGIFNFGSIVEASGIKSIGEEAAFFAKEILYDGLTSKVHKWDYDEKSKSPVAINAHFTVPAAQDSDGYQPQTAEQLLKLSGAAYCGSLVETWECGTACEDTKDVVDTHPAATYNKEHDSMAYVTTFRGSDEPAIVAVFRGTVKWEHTQEDLDTAKVSPFEDCKE